MIQFKVRATLGMSHVRVTWFSRTLPTETWANCGAITVTPEEWVALKGDLDNRLHEIEILKNDE